MEETKKEERLTILLEEEVKNPQVSENALKVLKERYLARDDNGIVIETPKQLYLRVANAIASVEKPENRRKYAREFYNLMAENRFLPNSPTLMNAGRRLGLLSACLVLPVEDDLEKIFESVKTTAMCQRAGAGTGFNFSKLRPNGSIVKSSGGTTAGPLSFIDVFSQATSTIQQGAFRRGANMALLDCSHPDIINFILAKEDLKRWQNYNISVAITDKFMEQLETLPDTQHKVSHKEWGEGALWKKKNSNEVRAFRDDDAPDHRTDSIWYPWRLQDTWNLICSRAHSTGEPGLFFIDEVNRNNPVAHLGRIDACNPCITGDTKILTVNGPISIKELADGNCKKCNGKGDTGTHPHNGDILECYDCEGTGRKDKQDIKLFAWDPDSKLPVVRTGHRPRLTFRDAELLEVEFDSGLKVRCTKNHNFRTFRGEKIEAKDITVGQSLRAFSVSKHRDGHLRAHGWVANKCAHQWVHRMIWEEANGEIPEGYVIHHKDGNSENNRLDNLELLSAYDHQSEHYAERLAGGFVNPKTSPQVYQDLLQEHTNHKVISVKEAGRDDVYNITVQDVHTYIIVDPQYKGDGDSGVWSGVVSCNCGEQSLYPYDVCNLGSINLAKYVNKNGFDYKAFGLSIDTAIRFLDNVIDVNKYPIPEINEMSKKTRRIGLGVMGFADLLFKLNIPYDSNDALKLANDISAALKTFSFDYSSKLGVEKGNFGAWDKSEYEVPMRNAFRTTVAPTGTISIIANCSGGIEPLFALAFKRTVMPDASGKFKEMYEENEHWIAAIEESYSREIIKDNDREGLREHAIKHGSIKDYYTESYEDTAELRRVFVTSHDILPEWHVKMQEAWQEHIDNAVSKTINLPHDEPVETVSQVYWQAYYAKCKGITVYRDGCRNNVAGMKQPMSVDRGLNVDKIDSKIKEEKSPDTKNDELKSIPLEAKTRPITVYPAYRTQIKTQFGNLHVHIVLDETGNHEREIFAQLGKTGDLIAADLEAICRLASLSLKKGTTLEEVIDQLEGIGTTHIMPSEHGKIVSMPDAVAKALRKYVHFKSKTSQTTTTNNDEPKPSIEGPTKPDYGLKCPSCSTGRLVLQEGCQKCYSCGFSAC